MSPIHEHEIRHARQIATKRALLDALPIPAVFAAAIAAFAMVGSPVPWWLVFGGVFYGGLGVWGVVEEGRRRRAGDR